MAHVLWRDAQGKEGTLELGTQDALIGRALECAIRTDDAMVSRNHARLFTDGMQYYVEDLGSANGVFYQEQRVTRHALRHGDAVRCGSLWLRFVEGEATPTPSAAPPRYPVPAQPPAPSAPSQPVPPPSNAAFPVPPPSTNAAYPAPPPSSAFTMQPQPGMSGPPPSSAGAGWAPAPSPAAPGGGFDGEDLGRLRRRLEQMQAEMRILRGGGERATRMQLLEDEIARLGEENDKLKTRIAQLDAIYAAEGGDAKLRKAGLVAQTAAEIVAGLNDVLSNLRINVMAAEGEFDQFASNIPRASFELIREALRTSARDMELARELLRRLREIAG